jgi:hypothetical protein
MAQQLGPPLSEVTKSCAFVAVGDWPTGRATILSILMCQPEPSGRQSGDLGEKWPQFCLRNISIHASIQTSKNIIFPDLCHPYFLCYPPRACQCYTRQNQFAVCLRPQNTKISCHHCLVDVIERQMASAYHSIMHVLAFTSITAYRGRVCILAVEKRPGGQQRNFGTREWIPCTLLSILRKFLKYNISSYSYLNFFNVKEMEEGVGNNCKQTNTTERRKCTKKEQIKRRWS